MSIGHAIEFIKQFETDPTLRKECNLCKTLRELDSLLHEKKLSFAPSEFEDAINSLHVKCQSHEQAGCIKEIEMWYKLKKSFTNVEGD